MLKQPSNDSGGEERNKSVANIGSFWLMLQRQSGDYFWEVLAWKGKMNIHGQYDNIHKLKLGPLNDNKGVEHLWNISGTVAHAKQHHQIPS